jgi:outer membrane protein TolC
LAFAAGGFGGGINDFFGNFNGRSDFAATVVWTLQNFGLGNQALMRERRSQYAQATFRQASVEAQVAAQVASAFSVAFAHRQALAAAQREVADARESYRLNDDRVRRFPDQGRPIELLQAIQALAVARRDYLQVVSDYNRAQFHLFTALGHPPLCAFNQAERLPTTEPVVPAPPPGEAQVLPALRPTVASGNGTGGH